MGCGNSKSAEARAEAKRYNQRKKNGFKDPGLQKHINACKNQKKNLHHVDDPAKKRKQKVEKIKLKNKKEAKTGGLGGLNENELEKKRANLKHH
jgi:hypothetical protein